MITRHFSGIFPAKDIVGDYRAPRIEMWETNEIIFCQFVHEKLGSRCFQLDKRIYPDITPGQFLDRVLKGIQE